MVFTGSVEIDLNCDMGRSLNDRTVKPRQKFVDVIHRAQRLAPWNSGTSAARLVTGILGGRLTARCHSGARWARVAVRDFG